MSGKRDKRRLCGNHMMRVMCPFCTATVASGKEFHFHVSSLHGGFTKQGFVPLYCHSCEQPIQLYNTQETDCNLSTFIIHAHKCINLRQCPPRIALR